MNGRIFFKGASIAAAIIYALIAFFGVNGLFNPVIILSLLFLVSCLCVLLVQLLIAFAAILRHRPHQNIYALILIIIFLVSCVFFQKEIHAYGLKYLIASNVEKLNKAASNILLTSKEDQLQWRDEFDLWPEFIGPTRKVSWHNSGVVYIDFEGAPGSIVGLCYNPKHTFLPACVKSMGGDWFRLDADVDQ